jgi:hypothetical protein
VGLVAQEKKAHGDYFFAPGADTAVKQRVFNYRNFMIGFKFSFRERTIETTKGEFSFGSEYPVVWFNYTQGLSILGGDYTFSRVDLKVEDKIFIKYLGEFTWRLNGGIVIGEVPISNNYSGKGTYRLMNIYTPNAFTTMRTNEFYSDKYFALFLTHNFKNLLFDFKRWHPELMLVTNITFGSLRHREYHHDFDFNTLEKGYYESGIVIRKLLDLKIVDVGIGVMYRYGPYGFKNVSYNFAYNFTVFYGF